MLARDPILVSLSPSAVRVGVVARGELARVERLVLDPDGFEDLWRQELKPLDDVLRAACQAANVRGRRPALVLYHGQYSVAEVFSAPTTGGAALQAADLYLQQMLPAVRNGWVTARHVSHEQEDGPAAPVNAEDAKASGRRTLMLTVADTCDATDILASWARRSGLQAQGVLATKAAMLRCALDDADHKAHRGVRVHVHLGEHAMTLSGWVEGRLAFARCAEVGYALLSDAIYRSRRNAREGELTREEATRVLFSSGVPKIGQVMDAARQLRAEAVLPLIQPAVQRYVVELRQTLRFGMLENDLARATIVLAGPGAGIPHLAQTLSDAIELPVERLEGKGRSLQVGVAEDSVGDLGLALALRSKDAWMMPPSVRADRTARTLDLGVRGGALAAMVTLGAIAGINYADSLSTQERIEALTPRTEAIAELREARNQAAVRGAEASQLRELLRTNLGERPSWQGVLALLADAPLMGVEIEEIGGASEGDSSGVPTVLVHGRAPWETPAQDGKGKNQAREAHGGQSEDPVAKFVAKLGACPLVKSSRVVSTFADGPSQDVRRFVVALELHALEARPPSLAKRAGGSQ